ncbi:class I SAM-dependent RNA methyltransferase [Cognatishimia sp. F0-27]|uniref:class I SAM-dependent RNA methyltransferase n=1 Tax=Cognatishimia sp. F0-27 TaxID=2816855 RepID=UPI001D0C39C7|nr:TRAM domain-containing protein [Cognatishimia sp. F0-27]MCC1492481.1 class I SAM-dependent RNA methyltransferase [Cognatishimia sp. F0-27]
MERFEITRLGHRGDGIAQDAEGQTVFVPRTLPGEVVEGQRKGDTVPEPRIVTPSADRVSPPCRHAKSCGGCQLQHVSETFAARWKESVIRNALAAHGVEADIRPMLTSPPRSRRRATFSARRTKKGALAGFHALRSDVVIAVPDCTLVTPRLAAALPMVEALAVLGASRKGELSVQVTDSLSGLDVGVTGGKTPDVTLRQALSDIGRAFDLARIAWDDEVLTRRPPIQRFGSVDVVPPPGTFLQATQAGETALRAAVLDILAGSTCVADLFAGCGTFALPLAGKRPVHAVEANRAMLAALDHGWRQGTGLRKVTTEARDLFRNPLLPDELARFDGIALDPPRAGAEAQITQIIGARVPCVAYVSCNPVTFAKDAARMIAAGYEIGAVQGIDQFRWSTHVELVAGFTLKG